MTQPPPLPPPYPSHALINQIRDNMLCDNWLTRTSITHTQASAATSQQIQSCRLLIQQRMPGGGKFRLIAFPQCSKSPQYGSHASGTVALWPCRVGVCELCWHSFGLCLQDRTNFWHGALQVCNWLCVNLMALHIHRHFLSKDLHTKCHFAATESLNASFRLLISNQQVTL